MPLTEEQLKTISQKVWKWMSECFDTGVDKGEETITDLLLTKIKQADPMTAVKKFSHAEEMNNGADFAIQVGAKLFFVQAKRMYKDGQFSAIQGDEGLSQCKKLIASAEHNGGVAIYAFYIGAKGRANEALQGCLLLDANKVKDWISFFSSNPSYKQKWISADTLVSEAEFARPLWDLLKW